MLGKLLRSAAPVEERSTINLSQYALLRNQAALGSTYSPVPVTVQRALTHAASSACIDVLASSVSSTPLDVVRQQNNARLPVSPTPGVIEAPSGLVEQDVWRHQLVESMLTDGNGFGYVMGVDGMGRPTGIELLDAANVGDRRVVDGIPQVLVGGKVEQLFPYGDVWHVPGKLVRAGSPFAESPIARAAATIGAAIAARDFSSRFFGDGYHPTALAKSDRDVTPQQVQDVKDALNRMRTSREPGVFGTGWDIEFPTVDANNSTVSIDLARFAIEEACRFWLVPPSMIFAATSGQSVTYANVSQADIHYLKHSVEWLFVRLERALSRLLTRPQIVRFNRNAFLRSDAATRGDYLDKRLRNKTLSINEYHALEDEPPVADPEFDKPGIPGGPVLAAPPATGGE